MQITKIIESGATDYTKALAASMAQTKNALIGKILYDNAYIEYKLEEANKLYRVKETKWGKTTEYKTGWLPLKEAQAIMKLLKGNENDTSSI